jgi:ABC-type cobalamin/Fe3+-siderophores transport system ATPase subunit
MTHSDPRSEFLSNPFSTRFVRPGAVPYVFPPGSDAGQLLARLAACGWWGQILGPHGTGKSTLLHALQGPLQEAGRQVELYVRHTASPRAGRESVSVKRSFLGLGRSPKKSDPAASRAQVVVDGYEQLNRFQRWRLRHHCRHRGAGLLVTSHRPAGLPTLWTTELSVDLAQAVVERLLQGKDGERITAADVRQAFAAHAGNLRETLFALYDLFEQRSAPAHRAQSVAVVSSRPDTIRERSQAARSSIAARGATR